MSENPVVNGNILQYIEERGREAQHRQLSSFSRGKELYLAYYSQKGEKCFVKGSFYRYENKRLYLKITEQWKDKSWVPLQKLNGTTGSIPLEIMVLELDAIRFMSNP
ncbi:hypothetical protein HZB00_00520 [Candidatus Woesearchaeota archaeon]|nr:hypothetical protein [Candidatus Woesearchaeota archaeon]